MSQVLTTYIGTRVELPAGIADMHVAVETLSNFRPDRLIITEAPGVFLEGVSLASTRLWKAPFPLDRQTDQVLVGWPTMVAGAQLWLRFSNRAAHMREVTVGFWGMAAAARW